MSPGNTPGEAPSGIAKDLPPPRLNPRLRGDRHRAGEPQYQVDQGSENRAHTA